MRKKLRQSTDQDSAWKELLDAYLPAFIKFFFPEIYPEINWQRGYEAQDKELAQIHPNDLMGRLLADKLFKVWLLNGQEIWLLIHIEIQVQASQKFNRRVFVYNYRLMNAHGVEVVSLAVLTGEQPGQSGKFRTERWGCSHDFQFPAVRIIDYRDRWDELEKSDNPFAAAVKAQLKALETKGDVEQRYQWKQKLIFDLYHRGFTRHEITNLFRFIEWVVKIPDDLQTKLEDEIYKYEVRNNMPYLSNMERRAIERGTQKGLEIGLQQGLQQGILSNITLIWETKFGAVSRTVKSQLSKLSSEQCQTLTTKLIADTTKSELINWLKTQSPSQ
jgi:hypothetical protein